MGNLKLAEMSLLQALHARECACWARDKVRDFLEYSNSTKTQNVDMSYQTFFYTSRKLCPQRTSGSRDYHQVALS